MSPSVGEYLLIAQREIEEVRGSLDREQVAQGSTSRRNREINGIDRALHAIRNARTIVGLESEVGPPGDDPPEEPKGLTGRGKRVT